MDGLAAFLAARLDEDEETARATSRPGWRKWGIEPWYNGEFLNDGRTERADLWGAGGAGCFTGQGALPTVIADHIALHDPDRALREVEAKRRRLQRWIDAEHDDASTAGPYFVAVLDDASVYSDHADYLPGWAPA